MSETLYEYCVRMGREDLLEEWDSDRNGELTPEQVSYGSHRTAWWRCEQGHEWPARISSRRAYGCPYCTGRKPIPGETDLQSQFPELTAQWRPDKNGSLQPSDVTGNSNRKVWWRCPQGHEWEAQISSMTRMKRSCPYCSGRKAWPGCNDLATRMPEIASQWHPELNGDLTPQRVTVGSHRKVWWICPEGHVWKAAVFSRTGRQKCGCPVCAGRVRPKTQYLYSFTPVMHM